MWLRTYSNIFSKEPSLCLDELTVFEEGISIMWNVLLSLFGNDLGVLPREPFAVQFYLVGLLV